MEKIPHIEGPPWKMVGRFETFEEADAKRTQLLDKETLQVKVAWSRRLDKFAVKTRVDPIVALEEEKHLAREEKKRRKVKLNKKRRKK